MFDCALSLAVRLGSAAVLLGWLLSACGQLNGRGYLLLGIPISLATVIVTLREGKLQSRGKTARRLKLWCKRKRWLPLIYFFTFALIVIGSALHEPNNFDGVSYREPKVLYWLDAQRWQWIASPYEAINYTLPNYEWLTVPFFLATREFHSTVVINWIAFLFLPSLLFTLMRAFGARGRAAFDWMWIFPSGYIIALEAGGIGNDVVGMVALLAALHFANRFVRDGKGGQLFDALLAAGFCTGVKLSNLPLPVFVLIILLRGRVKLFAKPKALAAGLVLAVAISALIPILNNIRNVGTVFGSTTKLDQIDNVAAGWAGNGIITVTSALQPPVFPGAKKIMSAAEQRLGENFLTWMREHYDKFTMRLHEMPQEESGGLGLGVTAALMIAAGVWLRARNKIAPGAPPGLLRWQRMTWWGWFGFAVLVIAAKLGTGLAFPRNMLPWIPLALAPVAAFFGRAPLCSSFLWRAGAPLAALSVWPAISLNPSRPLVPPSMILSIVERMHLSAGMQEQMQVTYEIYGKRADAFADLRTDLPPGTKVLGLVSDGSEPTVSYWKPFFSRRCVYLVTDAEMHAAPAKGVEYFIVADNSCLRYFGIHTDEFLAKYGAKEIKSVPVRMLVGWPAARYTLAKFDKAGR
jgi:hypothetical protein